MNSLVARWLSREKRKGWEIIFVFEINSDSSSDHFMYEIWKLSFTDLNMK